MLVSDCSQCVAALVSSEFLNGTTSSSGSSSSSSGCLQRSIDEMMDTLEPLPSRRRMSLRSNCHRHSRVQPSRNLDDTPPPLPAVICYTRSRPPKGFLTPWHFENLYMETLLLFNSAAYDVLHRVRLVIVVLVCVRVCVEVVVRSKSLFGSCTNSILTAILVQCTQ